MRIFIKMRELLLNHKDLFIKIEKIENKLEGQEYEIKILFEYLKKLMQQKKQFENRNARNQIGYIKDKNHE